ncbi:MAG: DNA topoisomerase IB [Anaerolineae bacterium]|nr:DNA topoisomerase IB [Gemmatimonadaceae bacterium]
MRWIKRHGSPKGGFRYTDSTGVATRNAHILSRIDALRIPPGWADVHIAVNAKAAVQAWGMDVKGRKQYRYHGSAIARGDSRKHYRVRRLARDLPRIRAKLHEDFRRDDLSKERVASAAVRLLNVGFFRVGSDRYAKENKTFGLTTLRKRHVRVEGSDITFEYKGKRAIRQWKMISDRDLAAFILQLQGLPGERLFRYQTDGGWADLSARDVNEYVRGLTGWRYSAKDFRTWGGTLRFATVLAELGAAPTLNARKRQVVLAVRLVAAELGNTPAICRKSYVHPIVIARYLDAGETMQLGQSKARVNGHAPEEKALIRFLDRHFPERRKRRRSEDAAE